MSDKGALLAEHIRKLSGFVVVDAIDPPYNHMGATLTDAVLQAGVRYKTVVEPRVEKLREQYPNSRTTSDFAALLESPGPELLLNWKGRRKLDTLQTLTAFLVGQCVETEENFRAWIVADANFARLHQIKGIKDKTSHYLAILLGVPNVAVDRHLFRFLAEAGIDTENNYKRAQTIIREAANSIGVHESLLDHSIWRYMSERSEETVS